MADPDDNDHSTPTEAGSDPDDVASLRSRIASVQEDLEGLQEEMSEVTEAIDDLEENVDDRTVHREEVESDLRGYVRKRIRRGHARGWGPYLVLLYGTIMTIGAFAELSGGWAILAMFVIWLSTLGLYVLMVLAGFGVSLLSAPRRAKHVARTALDELEDIRS